MVIPMMQCASGCAVSNAGDTNRAASSDKTISVSNCRWPLARCARMRMAATDDDDDDDEDDDDDDDDDEDDDDDDDDN